MSVLDYIAMDASGGPAAAVLSGEAPKVGVWDTVLEFGTYQHVTVDGKPIDQVFDASRAQAMLDDFKQHPESDIFYDKKHEVVELVSAVEGEPLSAYRARLQEWARNEEGDGHALAWANALCSVVGSQVVRYEPHPGAPPAQPSYEKLCADQGRRVPDGVYCHRSEVTPLGASPGGMRAFRYTSPFFVSQRDGDRLLCLTSTNDPRMRGAALARFEREGARCVAFTRMSAPGPQEKSMPFDKEMMARCGMEESDSEAAKVEKFAKYIRKLEDEKAASDKDKSEAMGRVAKMEEDAKAEAMARQKMADELSEMKRKFEEGKGKPFGGKETPAEEKAEKEAMQAMQRTVASLQEKLAVVTDTLKRTQENQEADRKVAMERKQRDDDAAAERWAQDALVRGRWDAMHAGGAKETDPEKRIAMTRAHLAKKYKADPAQAESDLFEAGTFQPDERLAMSRLTQGGAGIGAPDPREGAADPDAQMDAEIARIQREAKTAGQAMGHAVAMQRVKREKPALYERYMNNLVGR